MEIPIWNLDLNLKKDFELKRNLVLSLIDNLKRCFNDLSFDEKIFICKDPKFDTKLKIDYIRLFLLKKINNTYDKFEKKLDIDKDIKYLAIFFKESIDSIDNDEELKFFYNLLIKGENSHFSWFLSLVEQNRILKEKLEINIKILILSLYLFF